jgi:hypothetical protein
LRFHSSLGEQTVNNFCVQHFFSTEPGDERLRTQTDVLDYVNDDNFVVRLKTLSDHILLAKVPPHGTLVAIWESVAKRLKKPQGGISPPSLVPGDPFAMPTSHSLSSGVSTPRGHSSSDRFAVGCRLAAHQVSTR